jgi:hypothetical protein
VGHNQPIAKELQGIAETSKSGVKRCADERSRSDGVAFAQSIRKLYALERTGVERSASKCRTGQGRTSVQTDHAFTDKVRPEASAVWDVFRATRERHVYSVERDPFWLGTVLVGRALMGSQSESWH